MSKEHKCRHCDAPPRIAGKQLCQFHLDWSRANILNKQRDAKTLAYRLEKCIQCRKPNERHPLIICGACYEKAQMRRKQTERKLKDAVLDIYGRACACCGEKEPLCLTLDHVDNDGRFDVHGHKLYKQILDSDFLRADLQTLCYNCNIGRYLNGGICPHAAG